ncbi:Uracil-DNA glycosylase [candidate division SR1 bacterium RAAC1_SR1_1]|nr:Uracil-DNA glycosylase [candidate division SR1 bacterium RAAC1_SR1_1]
MIDIAAIQIHSSWKNILRDEFQKPYFEQIKQFLEQEKLAGNIVFPKGSDIFNAFNQTPFDDVKIVILGQDPYHGEGEAHGLCFSVQDGVRVPPSLKNIFKELLTDIPGFVIPVSGNLISWAKQGVFLLNATLTVRKDTPNSHKDAGWQQFTDAVIKKISDEKKGVVFLLWGAYAQGKIGLIDQEKHLVLQAAHPSPFSSYRGFFGCKHFSQTNNFLISQGKQPINWKITT